MRQCYSGEASADTIDMAPDHAHPEETQDHENCPTPTAHRRLDESHRWWHGCLSNYDDVASFRANLNACLQALRHTTFVLQKEKRLIKDFQSWYTPWQERLKADHIMKWVVKSRDRVVHEGDLEIHSTALYRVVLDYDSLASMLGESLPDAETTPLAEHKMSPLTRPSEYVRKLRSLDLPTHVMEGGTLFVERRWVDAKLPQRELLDALAHAYGVLSLLVEDAHHRAGIASMIAIDNSEQLIVLPKNEQHMGRLPCMITSREARTTAYRILDGSLVGENLRAQIRPDTSLSERALKRYNFERPSSVGPTELHEDVASYLEMAKRVLEKDKYHSWIVIFKRKGHVVDLNAFLPSDRAEKLTVSQRIAEHVARNAYDAVILIAESWFSSIEHDSTGQIIQPAHAKSKREALTIFGESAAGETVSRVQFFHRRFKKIIWDEMIEEVGDSATYKTLSPVRAVWQHWSNTKSAQQ